MTTINLKDFYPWYTHDEFIEIPEEIAAELFADRRYRKTQERYARREKLLSLDAGDGVEEEASIHAADSPDAVYMMSERHCALCRALNSLPETQGRRVDAHFLLGKSRKEIAANENVTESSVNESIARGLHAMKIYLMNF